MSRLYMIVIAVFIPSARVGLYLYIPKSPAYGLYYAKGLNLKMNIKNVMFLALLTALTACGGGSGADSTSVDASDATDKVVSAPAAEAKPASAEPEVDLYNVDEIELRGVRLGMTPEEALQALATFYSISPDDININLIESKIPIIEIQNVAFEYRYLSDGELVYVRFTPSLADKDVGYMVASYVRVNMENHMSVEAGGKQSAQWQKDITEKYGPVSIERGRSAYWCSAHSAGEKRCDKKSATLTVQNLYRPEMFLSNREYYRLWYEELKTWADESDKAGTIEFSSKVYNISTHVCRRNEKITHDNCKVGEPNGDKSIRDRG